MIVEVGDEIGLALRVAGIVPQVPPLEWIVTKIVELALAAPGCSHTHCPGAVERPSPLPPPRSFRLRKGTAPPPVNCGSVTFQRSIALIGMRSAVRDC